MLALYSPRDHPVLSARCGRGLGVLAGLLLVVLVAAPAAAKTNNAQRACEDAAKIYTPTSNRLDAIGPIILRMKQSGAPALKRIGNTLGSNTQDPDALYSLKAWCRSRFPKDKTIKRAPFVVPTTTTTTTTAPPQPVAYDGGGDDVVQITKPASTAALYATYSGEHNFIVTGLDANQQRVGGLVNAIGAYTGTVPLDFRAGESTSFLQIMASGPWHIEIRPLSTLASFSTNGVGSGDDVLRYTGKTGIASLNYSGEHNFIVTEYSSTGSINNLVNTIGAYSGRVPITGGGTNVIEFKASGPWTITVS